MQISVSKAKGRLAELVRRAEAGEEVVLTMRGTASVRLVPVSKATSTPSQGRRAVMEAAQRSALARLNAGTTAARSQDFLYGDDGLPP
jgi:prevent-host-death family protein